jgi:hypothetical protein
MFFLRIIFVGGGWEGMAESRTTDDTEGDGRMETEERGGTRKDADGRGWTRMGAGFLHTSYALSVAGRCGRWFLFFDFIVLSAWSVVFLIFGSPWAARGIEAEILLAQPKDWSGKPGFLPVWPAKNAPALLKIPG